MDLHGFAVGFVFMSRQRIQQSLSLAEHWLRSAHFPLKVRLGPSSSGIGGGANSVHGKGPKAELPISPGPGRCMKDREERTVGWKSGGTASFSYNMRSRESYGCPNLFKKANTGQCRYSAEKQHRPELNFKCALTWTTGNGDFLGKRY